MITDEEIELNAYLGTDFAQSVIAEVGQDVVEAIWRQGYLASSQVAVREVTEHVEAIKNQFSNREGE